MKILIAVDGSECSLRAARFAVEHADWLRERPTLVLLNVQEPVLAGRVAAYMSHDEIEGLYAKAADEALAAASGLLRSAGIDFETATRVGEAGEAIAGFAASGGFDLIVMGSHGYGALGNVVMGSVATKVLAHTRVPVLLVR